MHFYACKQQQKYWTMDDNTEAIDMTSKSASKFEIPQAKNG